MAGVSWFKTQVGFYRDEKIKQIETLPSGQEIAYLWPKMLSLTAEKNLGGELILHDEQPYTAEMLATEFNVKPTLMRLALKTFHEFRMIDIESDGTIVISNWGKYQNLEGLDKIREQNRERKRRQRQKQMEQRNQRLLSRYDVEDDPKWLQKHPQTLPLSAGCHVTGHVTLRDRVTQNRVTVTPVEEENKNKIKIKEEEKEKSLSQKETENREDVVQHAEAKAFFRKLAKDVFRTTLGEIWPDYLGYLLNELLPIRPADLWLIDWFYGLPSDHEIFTVTRRRQSMWALLENFRSEVEKIRSARRLIDLPMNLSIEEKDEDSNEPEHQEWTEELYRGLCKAIDVEKIDVNTLPPTFSELDEDIQRRVLAVIEAERDEKQR
jgi:predicted phage replisome organizer